MVKSNWKQHFALIKFGQTFPYTCEQGKTHSSTTFYLLIISANWCPVPPDVEEGGAIYANSTGNKFGVVCRGSNGTDEHPGKEIRHFLGCTRSIVYEL
jgi:hypothetical protein